jgi:anti-sigma regulatory factor (Ser/Thr protein kinase)
MSERQNVKQTILSLAAKGWTTSGEVQKAARITRQAAHHHLRALVRDGILRLVGSGRGARYIQTALFAATFATAGAAEDRVWRQVRRAVPPVDGLAPNVRDIVGYAFTEMVNNAIEHSGAPEVRIVIQHDQRVWAFEVVDEGVGAFEHVRRSFQLPDALAALQHLMKGKVTSSPTHHSGQGIFFTSRAVDLFRLEANGLAWTVDNRRRDQAAGTSPRHQGTRVRCELDETSTTELRAVFDAFSDAGSLAFDRSTLRLIDRGLSLVSRSEARRIAAGLERFREVTLDFLDVRDVGQGFVDELFRVWARDHPGTALIPVNMSPPVEAMIRRGRADAAGESQTAR